MFLCYWIVTFSLPLVTSWTSVASVMQTVILTLPSQHSTTEPGTMNKQYFVFPNKNRWKVKTQNTNINTIEIIFGFSSMTTLSTFTLVALASLISIIPVELDDLTSHGITRQSGSVGLKYETTKVTKLQLLFHQFCCLSTEQFICMY